MASPAPTSTPPPRRALRRPIFLAISAAVALAVLIIAHAVMLPFLLAIVIAYVLTPAVAWVERRKVPRAAAILLIYAALLGVMALFVRLAVPRIGYELRGLRDEIPKTATIVKERWVPAIEGKMRELGLAPPPPAPAPPEPPQEEKAGAIVVRPLPDGAYAIDVGSGVAVVQTKRGYMIEPARGAREPREEAFDPTRFVADALGRSFVYAQENTLELARLGRDIIAGVSRVIFVFFITLMLAAYLMMTREKIFGFFESLVRPSSRPSWRALVSRVDQGLAGVVRGQLIICVINGVLSAIGFGIVGLKYWPVMALVAAVFSLIPIFGSIVSAIPAVAVGLTQGFGTAVFVLAWIVGIHQVEANLLNPKIMGDAAKIHPVLVVFSLLVGEHFFGAVGALLAVPCMSLAKSLFLHFRNLAHASDPELAVESPPPSRR